MLSGQDLEQKIADTDSEDLQTPERSETLAVTPDDDGVVRLAIARLFEIDDSEGILTNRSRLDRIINWARQRGAVDRGSIVAEVVQFRNMFGQPNIYNTGMLAHLDSERMNLNQEIMKFVPAHG